MLRGHGLPWHGPLWQTQGNRPAINALPCVVASPPSTFAARSNVRCCHRPPACGFVRGLGAVGNTQRSSAWGAPGPGLHVWEDGPGRREGERAPGGGPPAQRPYPEASRSLTGFQAQMNTSDSWPRSTVALLGGISTSPSISIGFEWLSGVGNRSRPVAHRPGARSRPGSLGLQTAAVSELSLLGTGAAAVQ